MTRAKKVTKRRKAVKNNYHYNREWGFAEAVMEPVITIHSMTVKTQILKDNPIKLDENCFLRGSGIYNVPDPILYKHNIFPNSVIPVQAGKERTECGHQNDDKKTQPAYAGA